MWSYPDGIKIYDSKLQIINDPEPQFSFSSFLGNCNPPDTIHCFVLTDYNLNRTYCTCLTWHQKNFVEDDQRLQNNVNDIPNHNNYSKTIPKCSLQELTSNPLLLDPQTAMIYVPKTLIVCSEFGCFEYQRQLVKLYYQKAVKSGNISIEVEELNKFQQLVSRFGYPKGQKIYDQAALRPKIQKKPIIYRTRHNKQPTIVPQPTHLKSISGKFLTAFYTSFLIHPSFTSSPTLITENNVLAAYSPIIQNSSLPLSSVDILKTFELFGIDNMLLLWKCLLLQKQILVFCSDPYRIIQLFQTLLYILQPITWQGIYIPFLPFHLHHHVDAIGGYIIGMSHIHMDYIIENFNLKNKCFVNIDDMIIVQEGNANNISLPEDIKNYMVNKLVDLLGKGSINNIANVTKFINSNKMYSPPDFQTTLQSRMVLEIKTIFLDGILYLLNNYIPYVTWTQQNGVIIDKQTYLAKFKQNKYNQTQANIKMKIQFLTAMMKTMVFIRLVQYHLKTMKNLGWKQKGFKQLYVYCYNILESQLNKSDKKSEIWMFPEIAHHHNYIAYTINQMLKQISQPTQYKIQHYATKYVKYIQYLNPQKIIPKKAINNQRSWWQILTFKKQVPKVSLADRRQKLNRNNTILIDSVINLEHIFGWLADTNEILNFEAKKKQLLKKETKLKIKQKNTIEDQKPSKINHNHNYQLSEHDKKSDKQLFLVGNQSQNQLGNH